MNKTAGFIRERAVNLKTSSAIMLVFSITIICIAILFYPVIPSVLNYPPGTVNTQFQIDVNSFTYTQQFFIILFLILLLGNTYLKVLLRRVDGWRKLDKSDLSGISSIRRKCLNLPYTIYIMQILVPNLVVIVVMTILKRGLDLNSVRIWILIFSFMTLAAVVTHIFSKRIFVNVMLNIGGPQDNPDKNFRLRSKIFLQLIPVIMVGILFTASIGYSRVIKDKSEIEFAYYEMQLENIFSGRSFGDIGEAETLLRGVKLINPYDDAFVIDPEGKVTVSDGSVLSDFYLKYIRELSVQYSGRVYDFYSVDTQGVIKRIEINGREWILGIKYDINSEETVYFFVVSFVVLFILNVLVLYFFSKTLAEDVSRVTSSLIEIAGGVETDIDKKLAVTSNDEIGDLVLAFNKIQQREIQNINSLKENQSILLEQERLASLGQLIGGIAHNLKTPIMSLAGGIEALKDLAYEYRDSIDDESVTISDHKDIAKDMLSWLDKMKPYCAYMSDVISAVKGQAVQMNASSTAKFTVDELVKRVELLMKHELKKYYCELRIDSQIDMSTEIKGEVNNMVQVFDNIIINAMQAYEGKTGTIDLRIVRSGDNIEFTFRDYAKGIPRHICDRLFKEMVTTKGKNGTGLGLYMSYSTIKGRFGGNMSFSSMEGNGTTFFISIPCIAYRSQEVYR